MFMSGSVILDEYAKTLIYNFRLAKLHITKFIVWALAKNKIQL